MSKYHAVKTIVDGIVFASKAEVARYWELKLAQQAGEIHGLTLQPRFPIVINNKKVCDYIADFEYITSSGVRVIEDVKGQRLPLYRLKKKMFEAAYGMRITEICD